ARARAPRAARAAAACRAAGRGAAPPRRARGAGRSPSRPRSGAGIGPSWPSHLIAAQHGRRNHPVPFSGKSCFVSGSTAKAGGNTALSSDPPGPGPGLAPGPPHPHGGPSVRMSLVYPLAAGLVVALAAAAVPARATSDLERLEQLEQEVALLKRKMEVQ